MSELKFYEYSGFIGLDGETSDSLQSCSLSHEEIKYLRTISDTVVPGKKIFEIGASSIRATSMVGVVSFGGVHIEILPKLLKNRALNESSRQHSILDNLMFMLSYTNALEINDTGIGALSQNQDSFIEAYISIFAQRLCKHLIRFGTPKAYVEKSENLLISSMDNQH